MGPWWILAVSLVWTLVSVNMMNRLICSNAESDACPAQGTLIPPDNFTYVPDKDEHSHDPDEDANRNALFCDLYTAIQKQFRSIENIYNDIAILHEESANILTLDAVKLKMQSWQRNRKLPNLESVNDFNEQMEMENFANISRHNRGKIEIFPIAWIPVLDKTPESCLAVVQKLSSLKTNWRPRKIFHDFDDDYSKSFAEIFPTAIKRGTFLSHCMIMMKEVNRLNLSIRDGPTAIILAKIIALSLLPASKILENFCPIVSSLSNQQLQMFRALLNYYIHNWINGVGVNNYSFFKNARCLVKNSDIIIRHMNNHLRNGRTGWDFLEKILSCSEQCDFHFDHYQEHQKINWSGYKIKNIFTGKKLCKPLDKLWQNIGESQNCQDFLKKIGTLLIPILKNMTVTGINLSPQFKLMRREDNNSEIALNLDEIVRRSNQNLLANQPTNNNLERLEIELEATDQAEEEEEEEEISTCCICKDRRPIMRYQPCGHVVTCEQCNTGWFESRRDDGREMDCVMCRAAVNLVEFAELERCLGIIYMVYIENHTWKYTGMYSSTISRRPASFFVRCIHHGAPKELKKKVKEPIVRTNCPAYFRMNIHNNETLRIYQWNEEHNCETMPASIASSSSVSQQQKQQQLVSKTMPAKNCQQKRSHEPDSSSGDEFANSPSQSTSRSRCPSKKKRLPLSPIVVPQKHANLPFNSEENTDEDISEKDDDGTSVQSPPFSPLSSPVKQPDGNNADATYSLSENSIVFDENLPVIAEDENNEILQVLLGGYFKVSTPEDSLVE
ncbi:hypothetical protein G9C98_003110 [Cotesia typhae]|uniref:RING-type domain-containing protein n=2 Tax=Cotesia typhae TaxID=2053667 RepID=A0A8J5QL79_9HYME|nr:hypothetical protein G9C98_003110 [Cotesia typhae]